MKEFIEFIAKYLVDEPEAVIVEETIDQERKVNLTLRVKKEDVGKVIGKKGKTVTAMRTLLTAIAAKEDKRAMLEILD
ncbi:MAG: KH domain-containing protein [Ignavibacteriaceae bacterium]|nr:KH domain-containing protein [Ignavibacteriaceae bacterium]